MNLSKVFEIFETNAEKCNAYYYRYENVSRRKYPSQTNAECCKAYRLRKKCFFTPKKHIFLRCLGYFFFYRVNILVLSYLFVTDVPWRIHDCARLWIVEFRDWQCDFSLLYPIAVIHMSRLVLL
ncbi:uncharacterized protein LOC122522723 [Polistes fuscatus]|uniref:uncharacterized protein LOC122513797 n=1 Tax=Polistes fuscatus TaxID=30207 RepID=UPI001CA7CACB|nr:uncharacterized protein LOC122513797 [Polistes fuscatus]XP_043499941.1 uncharacterized protein LOC122522723 [Polistes fuscatus]